MALKAVFFDVGETLVDEERWWRELAEREGLQPHVVWAALGVTIERGEEHNELWRHLGIERPSAWWNDLQYQLGDLYDDAISCLEAVRALGLRVGIVGNQTTALEQWARDAALPADVISSSASLGVRKPDPAFFERVVELAGCAPRELAYVGDRVDNDVLPAASAGLVAVHVRRGPWGRLQRTPSGGSARRRRSRIAAGRASLTAMSDLRIGIGIDAHAFEAGVPLVLGGVSIEHARGLAGHSDGDVIAHALTDALLGAAGLADIGSLFPSDEERYRGADSLELLAEAYRHVRERGYELVNADCVLIGQEPRIAPYREEMSSRLAEALGVEVERVGVRATTTDFLGFTGRGEGLAAQAVALLERANRADGSQASVAPSTRPVLAPGARARPGASCRQRSRDLP